MTASIEIEEMVKIIATDEPTTLLDVRRKADYLADPRQIKGALRRDLNDGHLDRATAVPSNRGLLLPRGESV